MLQANTALLPDSVADLIAVIGLGATQKLIERLGGVSFRFGKGHTDTPRLRLLHDCIGETATAKLLAVYGGDCLYIPRAQQALIAHRNQQFLSELAERVEAGDSKTLALLTLCPKYGISDRSAWALLRKQRPSPQLALKLNSSDNPK